MTTIVSDPTIHLIHISEYMLLLYFPPSKSLFNLYALFITPATIFYVQHSLNYIILSIYNC